MLEDRLKIHKDLDNEYRLKQIRLNVIGIIYFQSTLLQVPDRGTMASQVIGKKKYLEDLIEYVPSVSQCH